MQVGDERVDGLDPHCLPAICAVALPRSWVALHGVRVNFVLAGGRSARNHATDRRGRPGFVCVPKYGPPSILRRKLFSDFLI